MNKREENKDMPDFQHLNDRIIANPSPEPSIVIKTNLDPKEPTDENPYFIEGKSDEEKFSSYFSEKE
jgi:hypothetical protein